MHGFFYFALAIVAICGRLTGLCEGLMLAVTRKIGEKIHINDDIIIEVLDVKSKTVRIGVTAPPRHLIFRGEIYEKIIAANKEMVAAQFTSDDVKTFLTQREKK